MRFIVYHSASGLIKRVGNCDPQDVQLQSGVDETAIGTVFTGEIHPDRHKIQHGQLVDYAPPVDVDAAWATLRLRRNQLLTQSDWTQTVDNPMSSSTKLSWAAYRQALRELTDNTVDPTCPVWPPSPAT